METIIECYGGVVPNQDVFLLKATRQGVILHLPIQNANYSDSALLLNRIGDINAVLQGRALNATVRSVR